MHGAGIYRQRYGLDPGLGLTRAPEVRSEVEAFVAEQEAKFGGEPGEHRREYELLQLFDRLSLYFCMRDVEAGEPAELQGYAWSRSARGTFASAPIRSARRRPASPSCAVCSPRRTRRRSRDAARALAITVEA